MLALTAGHPFVDGSACSVEAAVTSASRRPVSVEGAVPSQHCCSNRCGRSSQYVVKKELLMHPKAYLLITLGQPLAVGAIALIAGAAAYAQPTATPEQKFPPGYLEAVSTGYENGQTTTSPSPPGQAVTGPAAPLSQASFLVPPTQATTTSTQSQKNKKHH
jgi:hypothetical protein